MWSLWFRLWDPKLECNAGVLWARGALCYPKARIRTAGVVGGRLLKALRLGPYAVLFPRGSSKTIIMGSFKGSGSSYTTIMDHGIRSQKTILVMVLET